LEGLEVFLGLKGNRFLKLDRFLKPRTMRLYDCGSMNEQSDRT
jgi:hypothetical protein